MQTGPNFATNLYDGTAAAYDRFRLAYPRVLTDDLLGRVQPTRRGRLLDLACGTGQLAFSLQDYFAEVWAVDQESDMVRLVDAKAARGGHTIRAITSPAEELSAESASFELTTIGNAFHRLRRDGVARRALAWLCPGGHLALCWSSSPWAGNADWQEVLNAVLDQWRSKLSVRDRLPQDWEGARRARPDLATLVDAGFEPVGRYEFQVEHRWAVASCSATWATEFATPLTSGQYDSVAIATRVAGR